jgi:GR25 family glycosyltransferase involved in LPS biosynthesis
MKTYIIYNSSNPASVKNAALCLNSFENFPSWKPELFDGCTPKDLEHLDAKYNLKNDRAKYKIDNPIYKSKKSCFYSHFTLWLKCIELNEPIAILEHDTYCKGDIPENFRFSGIVHFSAESVFNSFSMYRSIRKTYSDLKVGLHSITLMLTPENTEKCIAGNTAYGITPAAAKILVDNCFKYGWQQNDILMSIKLCNIEVLVPSIIVYDRSRELKSSSKKSL